VTLVAKRRFGDCAVAALAGYLSLPYGDVAAVAKRVAPDYGEIGMDNRDMLRIARILGYPLKRTRRTLLDVCIVDIDFHAREWGHYAMLHHGLILDSDTSDVVPVEIYLKRERATIKACYVLK
jgi:hypothetical protein